MEILWHSLNAKAGQNSPSYYFNFLYQNKPLYHSRATAFGFACTLRTTEKLLCAVPMWFLFYAPQMETCNKVHEPLLATPGWLLWWHLEPTARWAAAMVHTQSYICVMCVRLRGGLRRLPGGDRGNHKLQQQQSWNFELVVVNIVTKMFPAPGEAKTVGGCGRPLKGWHVGNGVTVNSKLVRSKSYKVAIFRPSMCVSRGEFVLCEFVVVFSRKHATRLYCGKFVVPV